MAERVSRGGIPHLHELPYRLTLRGWEHFFTVDLYEAIDRHSRCADRAGQQGPHEGPSRVEAVEERFILRLLGCGRFGAFFLRVHRGRDGDQDNGEHCGGEECFDGIFHEFFGFFFFSLAGFAAF